MSGRAARSDLVLACGLFGGFVLLYAACGLAFHRTSPRAFAYLDQLFDADIPSRIIDLTRFSGPHHRTQFHPLFVLLLNPLGVALKAVLRAFGAEHAGRLAAILMCGSAGAAGVAVFFALLRRSGLAAAAALPWTLVFGFSASQVFSSVFPESWVFSTLAVLLLFALDERPATRLAAGVVAFGMAVTNLAAVFLARASSLDWTRERQSALRVLAVHLLLVLSATGVLSLLQTSLYAGTAPFWGVSGLLRDDRLSFVWPRHARELVARGGDLAVHFLAWNLAAPRTVIHADELRTVVDFPPGASNAFRPSGVAHGALWGALLAAAIVQGARTGSWRRPRFIALGLWTLAHAALHLVFGTSLFLYAGQWTFAVLAMAALLLDPGTSAHAPRSLVPASLLVLATLQVVTNAAFFVEIARAFA